MNNMDSMNLFFQLGYYLILGIIFILYCT